MRPQTATPVPERNDSSQSRTKSVAVGRSLSGSTRNGTATPAPASAVLPTPPAGSASKSICANLAEGFGKQGLSKTEFRRFVLMSIGSADEMRVWIRYCLDLGYTDEATWQHWRSEYEELAKMLNGLQRSLR